ncbi:MAG TPA: filamin, partial [Planctomycetes bacterium]|nr:filamin [Planctomycetota bacterium]
GFALERFDAVGVRRRDAALIDASGVLPDGTRLEDAAGLRSALLVRLPEFSAALARRLLVFALGRPLADSERAEVEALVGWLGPEVRLQELIAAVILTKPFLTRVEAP